MNLNQITIPSKNVEASVNFYKKLGLILIVDAMPRYARLECPDGDSTVSISLVEELRNGTGIKIYFEEEYLDEWVTRLKAQKIEFISEPEDKSWLWREAHLLDPDHNEIILFKAGENRKNPPWRIES